MTNRIFTFGCSFTKCPWPTWADIIIKENQKKCHGENWGRGGASNYYIFNAVIECHLKNQINAGDTVIIMWTSINRENHYVNRDWITPGSIYLNEQYPKNYVEKFADTRGFMIRDYSLIYAIDQLLEKIGCKYYFLSMIDLVYSDELNNSSIENQDIINKYDFLLKKIKPSVYDIIFNKDWNTRPNINIFDKNLSEDNKKIIEKNISNVKKSYENLSGIEWPTFDEYWNNRNLEKYKSHIINEIKFLEEKLEWERFKKEWVRLNSHPTPAEHLEYIENVLPEFIITKETRDWVSRLDQAVLTQDRMDRYWVNTTVKRW